MSVNFEKVIKAFMGGADESHEHSISSTKTLKIVGDKLINYQTVILQRYNEKYLFNYTRYSLPTGMLQKQILSLIPEDIIIRVYNVPINYSGSLSSYIVRKPE